MEDDPELGTGSAPRADRNAKLAAVAFAVVEIGALFLWLVMGRSQWFFADEWDFLADRTAWDLGDLFHSHDNHWSTLPILAYRLLWFVFGLHSYLPYLALVVLLHLTAAALLRAVMRRAGVDPWISTLAASAFALFGAGYHNIVWAFQIGFGASLVFGLTHLLLADHDGPVDRRDWLGLLAGFAGMLCSGVAVSMVIVVGLATLMRRSWRVAVLHTAPLAIIYLVWWVSIGHEEYVNRDLSITQLARFVRVGLAAAFDAMGQIPGVGLLLGVLLVGGLIMAWGPLGRAGLRVDAALPAALLAGAVVFLLISGAGRASLLGPDFARASRYGHVVTAMVLPALAVAANAVVRRWRVVSPLVVVLLVIGVPGNIHALAEYTQNQRTPQSRYRHLILSLPRTPIAEQVPRSVRPDASGADTARITIGWLLDGVQSGRIPGPGRITADQTAGNTFRLSLQQVHSSATVHCRSLAKPVDRHLEQGDAIGIRGGSVRVLPGPRSTASPIFLKFNPERGDKLVAVTGPLRVRLVQHNLFLPARLCAISESR